MHRHPMNDVSIASGGVPPGSADQTLLACSVWLYLGFIGAAAFGGGLILLFDGHTNGALALAIAIFGASLAPASWLAGWRAARASLGEARSVRTSITDDCAELAAWPGAAAVADSRQRSR